MRRPIAFTSALAGALIVVFVPALAAADMSGAPAMGGVAAPAGMKVSFTTRPAPGGVLVHVRVTDFTFSPQRMSPVDGKGTVRMGEGHAHLYVDGAAKPKLLIVSPWTYVGLSSGRHTLRVTLNADNHMEYLHGGRPIAASRSVVATSGTM